MAIGGVYGQDGVKKLLLTPAEKISAVHCSDEQFLDSYATAIRADLQHFLASNQQEISKEKADSISSNVEFFIRSACNAYNLSLAWFNKYVTENEEYRYDVSFRNMLRSRLLLDLYLLHDIQCPWCSGFTAPPEIAPHSLSPTEQRFIKNLQGAVSYDQDILLSILSSHTERIEAQRNMLCQLLKKVGASSILINHHHMDMENEPVIHAEDGSYKPVEKEDTVEFLAAEGAWDAYLCAICRAHSQMYQGEESKTPHFLAAAVAAASQNQRLQDLINFYHKVRTDGFLIHFNQFLIDESSQEHLKEIVRQSTYSQEQKLSLYAKAVGVEKLLRTPTYRRNPFEDFWSDDEFFRQYADATKKDMNAFIENELKDEYYTSRFGKEQSNKDAAECNRQVQELISCAQEAYQASLTWFENELSIFAHQWDSTEELHPQFRVALQNRLLTDLFYLGQNTANRWAGSIIENNSQGSAVIRSFPSRFEAALAARGWSTTPGFTEAQYKVGLQQYKACNHYRDYILYELYGAERNNPKPQTEATHGILVTLSEILTTLAHGKQNKPESDVHDEKNAKYRKSIELFQLAEAAWEKYMKALDAILYPIDNDYFYGSGINGWCREFENNRLDSHNTYLLYLIHFAGNGLFPYSDPIDFTQYELTEEAAEALSKLPG